MTEIYLEILDDPQASAVSTVDETPTVEISIQQDVSGVTIPVLEFLEIIEQGPQGPPDTSGLAFILWDGTEYAPRSTVTNDPNRVVVWIGPVSPFIDGIYALDNVDVWWSTSA